MNFNLNISQRIAVTSFLSLVVAAAIGVTAATRMNVMASAADQITSDGIPVNNAARDVLLQVVNEETGVRGYVATGNEEYLAPLTQGREAILKDFAFLETRYNEHPVMKDLIETQLKPKLKEVDGFFDDLVEMVKDGKQKEAMDAMDDGKARMDAFRAVMVDVFADTDKLVADDRRESEEAHRSATLAILILGGLGLAASVGASIWLSRSFKGSVAKLTAWMDRLGQDVLNLGEAMQRFAKGDLTAKADAKLEKSEDKDEFAAVYNRAVGRVEQAVQAYEGARTKTAEVIGHVAHSASTVAETSQSLAASSQESGAAASEIAAGSQKLAVGAGEAAAIVTQLSAQVESVSESTNAQRELVGDARRALEEAAVSIDHVASAASGVKSAAETGAHAVRQTVDAMARVREQAEASTLKVRDLDTRGRQIGEIVRTIAGIADQTNLLALNAAIEAARAGEHGRGFAVVAEEVRKLAEQASHSTQEIGALVNAVRQSVDETVATIATTAQEVEEGARRSESAGEALTHILAAAESVATRANEVAGQTMNATRTMEAVARSAEDNAVSAQEMAAGADRVSQTIASVAAVSEESAAGAEELTASIEEVGAAAGELAEMSDELQRLVRQFRLESEDGKSHLRLAA
jgi:methyl-accepting chemotaxis protein